jgi:predicted acylesterase/phospholipase RssA
MNIMDKDNDKDTTKDTTKDIKDTSDIKHLVISGGGPSLLQYISAIQYLTEQEIINFDKIQTIYGTSAGALLGAILCMRFEWDVLNDYIIKRPWHELFSIKIQHILEAYTKKGILDRKIIEKVFQPLLLSKDISMDITLQELYEYSKIELHIYSFEINKFETEDISYLTHPNLPLLDAILMSLSIPVLMVPTIIDNKCYIDGGLCANYPLIYAINSGKNPDEILGFRNQYDTQEENHIDINNESTLLDFILCIFFKILNSFTKKDIPEIKHEVKFHVQKLSIEYLNSFLHSIELRKEYYQKGLESAITFYNTVFKN